jgi:ribosome-binding protein aMBF1 (putative translation factor)
MSRDRELEKREKRVLEELDNILRRWREICRRAREKVGELYGAH